MRPVLNREVETDTEPFRTRRVHKLPHQVASKRSIRNLVVRRLRVPKAESLVMLSGEHHILHARRLRRTCPSLRVEEVGIEARHIA